MDPSQRKSGRQDDISSNLQDFIEELNRSRKQAEIASSLIGELIRYHQHFCGETEKSFARLNRKLKEIYPAGYRDPVSFLLNFALACSPPHHAACSPHTHEHTVDRPQTRTNPNRWTRMPLPSPTVPLGPPISAIPRLGLCSSLVPALQQLMSE